MTDLFDEARAAGWTIIPGETRKRFDPSTGKRLSDEIVSAWIGEKNTGLRRAASTAEGLLASIEGARDTPGPEIAKRDTPATDLEARLGALESKVGDA